MKKTFFAMTMLSLMNFISCTNEVEKSIIMESDEKLEAAAIKSKVLDDIQKYVNYKLSESANTRSLENVSFEPYTIAGDTALYIVNYADGWDVMSTDQRTPMIMMSSDSGHLDVNGRNLPNPIRAYIGSIASEIHQLKQVENINNEIHPEWLKLPSKDDLIDLEKESGNRDGLEPGVGYWELLYSIPIGTPTVIVSPKMTTTKWTQYSPWHNYIPYACDTTNYLGPAGCDAVATAQYLYYLHYNTGSPSKAVSTATLTDATHHIYSFSNKTSSVWNNMAQDDSGTTNGKNLAAMLIAYVGQNNNTNYYAQYAYSDLSNDISVLNAESTSHFYLANYNYSYVINQLLSYNAVLMGAKDPNSNLGHAFIADRIITTNTTYCDYYGWVGTTSTGESANYIDENNGHIIGYKIKKQEIVTRTTYSYKMNWGWPGTYDDDVICNPYSNDDWYFAGDHLNANRTMARR